MSVSGRLAVPKNSPRPNAATRRLFLAAAFLLCGGGAFADTFYAASDNFLSRIVPAISAVGASSEAGGNDFSNHLFFVLGLFPLIKGIAAVFLCALCVGLITAGRQEPEMFKRFAPWIAGCILFMSAGNIAGALFYKSDSLSNILVYEATGARP
jgi:hypothetical protein